MRRSPGGTIVDVSAAPVLVDPSSRSHACSLRLASRNFCLAGEIASAFLDGEPANDVGEVGFLACRLASESCQWTSKDATRFAGVLPAPAHQSSYRRTHEDWVGT